MFAVPRHLALELEMALHQIQAFYVTPSAQRVLGAGCIDGAFNWRRTDPDLSRLTLGPPDPGLLNAWRDACADALVEEILVLGPDDRTPDFTPHPGPVGIKLLSAHEADSADMSALRGILREPDEVFTACWGDYGAGYRDGFVPPELGDETAEAFWAAYRDALRQFSGPVQGRSQDEFAAFANRAWRCGLARNDLSEAECSDGRNVRFSLLRFPFCSLVFDTESRTWSSDGWLPEDLERVDPGGEVRGACELEMAGRTETKAVSPDHLKASAPAGGSVAERSREALDAFLARVQSEVLIDRVKLSSLKGVGVQAPRSSTADALRSRASTDSTQPNSGAIDATGLSGAAVWTRVFWIPETTTLWVVWSNGYVAHDRLCPDGLVFAGLEVDGKWQDLRAEFGVGAEGLLFTEVRISVPADLLDAVSASNFELRIARDPDLEKDRLVVLFRMPANR
jgi:hypothetical protein